jgi:hypothetical protein
MHRTNIYLEDDQLTALKLLGAARRQSVATLVREAVDVYLHGRVDDARWRAEFDELLARIRSRVPASATPEQIEADVTAARQEVRRMRRAPRGR